MSKLTLELQIATQQADDLPSQSQMQLWLQTALTVAYSDAFVSLSLRVVDLDEMQQLNSQYRGRNYATNVLSFPFTCEDETILDELDGYIGDVAICWPVVKKEAIEQGKSLNAHFAHMLIHATLHLCGYDHIDPLEAQKMEALEVSLLSRHGIANPYKIETE